MLDSTTGAFFIFDEDLFKLLRKTLITSAHDNQLIRMIHRGGSPAEEQVTSLVKSGLKTRASDASSFVDKALHGALQRQGLRNCCCTLLHNRANGQIVGVVQVGNKIHGSYLHEDEQVLEALAAQAEVCFENYGLLRSCPLLVVLVGTLCSGHGRIACSLIHTRTFNLAVYKLRFWRLGLDLQVFSTTR
eukprot:SAG11_NODE_7_length_31267_cov_19.541966_31_plen_189_part_00